MLVLREEKNKDHEEHLRSEEERLGLLARQLDQEVRALKYMHTRKNLELF